MSGFRKFRSTLHRRRRSIEAVELGFLAGGSPQDGIGLAAEDLDGPSAVHQEFSDPETAPLDFSPSEEALEIGPAPIAWMKPKRETDN